MSENFRIAVYHTELSRDGPGLLLRDIVEGEDPQVLASLSVIRAADPDVLVLADFDYDASLSALTAFADRLETYSYRFAWPPNRGVQTGADRDGDGRFGEPEDAQGYGRFVGDGGLAILSKHPINESQVQDLSLMRWHMLDGAIPPDVIADDQRLSTTAHWIVPIKLTKNQTINFLVWHATPPVFDGPEDFNGRRNHDETAVWLRVLDGTLAKLDNTPFIIAGVSNLDPVDGDGRPDALKALLAHPRLKDPEPRSEGAIIAAGDDMGVNETHRADPALDTVDWPDDIARPGNLRVTYALPSRDFTILDSGVLWPVDFGTPLGEDVRLASRHRLVWLDLCIENCPLEASMQ